MRSTLALTALVLLAGCTVKAAPAHVLADSEWRFIAIDGEPVVSEKARLHFRNGELGANVGCNGMGGPWRIEDGRLVAGPLVQTEMYCEGPVWPQERATSALLVAAPELLIDGERLTLRSRGHFAELERVIPPKAG